MLKPSVIMHGRNNNLIDGNARVIDDNTINVTVRKEDIDLLKQNNSGTFIQFHLKKRKTVDKFGNTHVVVSGHYRKDIGDVQTGDVSNTAKSTLD